MGASAIEQIYLPNLLCASGIKPTKSQISKENWTFKLARSTYAQADKISPRTTTSRHRRTAPGITANAAEVSPRTTTSRHRRTALVLSAGPGVSRRRTASVLSAGPAIPHPHHSLEPCLFKSPPGHILSLSILTSK